MKTKWSEMNGKEKVIAVVYVIIGIITTIFAVMDISNKWEYAYVGWLISISLLLAIECTQKWKENRKMAIIEIVGGVIMLVCGIGSLFI